MVCRSAYGLSDIQSALPRSLGHCLWPCADISGFAGYSGVARYEDRYCRSQVHEAQKRCGLNGCRLSLLARCDPIHASAPFVGRVSWSGLVLARVEACRLSTVNGVVAGSSPAAGFGLCSSIGRAPNRRRASHIRASSRPDRSSVSPVVRVESLSVTDSNSGDAGSNPAGPASAGLSSSGPGRLR